MPENILPHLTEPPEQKIGRAASPEPLTAVQRYVKAQAAYAKARAAVERAIDMACETGASWAIDNLGKTEELSFRLYALVCRCREQLSPAELAAASGAGEPHA
jgi:hypothetical protein